MTSLGCNDFSIGIDIKQSKIKQISKHSFSRSLELKVQYILYPFPETSQQMNFVEVTELCWKTTHTALYPMDTEI